MKILLPVSIAKMMKRSMLFAGRREVGGILMAEDIGNQSFRIVNISIDEKSGTINSFSRSSDEHDKTLVRFHEANIGKHQRYNYLGEWHTHPRFSIQPSHKDIKAMANLVDGEGGVDFAVLLIAKLKWFRKLECSANLFVRNHASFYPVSVILENGN